MVRAVQKVHQICGYNLIEKFNSENSGFSGEKGKERERPQGGGTRENNLGFFYVIEVFVDEVLKFQKRHS